MIISTARRYIFVHSPKTGGTALSVALEGRAMADDILIGDTPKAVRRRGRVKKLTSAGRLWKHAMLADIEGIVAREAFDDYFLFMLVRNPWDRAVSYYHWLKEQTWQHPATELAKTTSFSEFLNAPATRKSLSQPYSAFLCDGAGQERAGHYMRLEALEEDLVPLWDHLGFNLSPISRVNASERPRDFRGFYSDQDAALLAEICAEDIARFNYRFELLPPQM